MIDLRSDTVTKPTKAMRAAMAAAEVGDDVYGEDPTVNRLQELAAEKLGTEATLFVSSGTQSNLIALLSHCERGDEYIVGQEAHTYKYEGGGGAVVGSIQPQPIDFEADGSLDLGLVKKKIKPIGKPLDVHFARTRLLCLENTHNGKVLPMDYLESASEFCDDHGLGLHLDGARVYNAAVMLAVPVQDITRYFDSVSCCLSKGLGAPVGSILGGSQELIAQAHRWRKVVGGGMRQAGILAAAGILALETHVDRLAEDHENATLLAAGLAGIEELRLDPAPVQTNMVFFGLDPEQAGPLCRFMERNGVLISGRDRFRLVTHLDVSRADIERTIDLFKQFFTS